MSSLVYPASLPGLTFDNTRSPNYNTGLQPALSGKESRIAYQLYPMMEFELQYEFLTGASQTSSDIRALLGLFMAMKAQADTFLFVDPEFNSVSLMPFATTVSGTTIYATTATYQNTGGPGGPEVVQNFNGAPTYYLSRFGSGSALFPELLSPSPRTNLILQSATFDNASWAKNNITVTPNTTLAPDGSTTMDSLVESTSTNVNHFFSQTATIPAGASIYTGYFFVKPSVRGWCAIQLTETLGGQSCIAWFNITTGVKGTVSSSANLSGATSTIAPVPDDPGVYLITISATKANAAVGLNLALFSAIADASVIYTGATGTVAIIAWGAQLENNFAPTMYIQTVAAQVSVTDYSLDAVGNLTMGAAIPSNATLLWSGSFFYRCRFTEDKMTVSQFVNKFWENKSVTLRQIRL